MTNTLPAVAKSVYTDCKKCGAERYFVVIAHTSETSAKVQCEVCKSKKTYKLESAKPKKTASGKSMAVRKPRASSLEKLAALHQEEYNTLMSQHESDPAATYSMKVRFEKSGKLSHPKFGVGVIKTILPDKIEVVFPDEVRSLVHNRPA